MKTTVKKACFLRTWGLNIELVADRLEGLSILRDLMQSEETGAGLKGDVKVPGISGDNVHLIDI
jgi:hypothetical protein